MKAKEMNYAPDNLEQCCKDALIKKVTESKAYIMNYERVGEHITSIKYYCNNCGKELKEIT